MDILITKVILWTLLIGIIKLLILSFGLLLIYLFIVFLYRKEIKNNNYKTLIKNIFLLLFIFSAVGLLGYYSFKGYQIYKSGDLGNLGKINFMGITIDSPVDESEYNEQLYKNFSQQIESALNQMDDDYGKKEANK